MNAPRRTPDVGGAATSAHGAASERNGRTTDAPRSPRRHVPAWRTAMGLFTIIPVHSPAEIDQETASRTLVWLPAIGGLLGAAAAASMFAIDLGGHSAARRLLAATVAIGLLALLTGGLHLDGLADTVDGLASRRSPAGTLAIMQRSDIGPMGVAAILFVILMQVGSLASLPAGWGSAAALVAAVVTGRVAVIQAAGLPAARPGGFGALIAGAATRRTRFAASAVLIGVVAAVGLAIGGLLLAARGLSAVAAGLLAAAFVRRAAQRRLGGMTGDVFGALIEVGTAMVLLVLALLS